MSREIVHQNDITVGDAHAIPQRRPISTARVTSLGVAGATARSSLEQLDKMVSLCLLLAVSQSSKQAPGGRQWIGRRWHPSPRAGAAWREVR